MDKKYNRNILNYKPSKKSKIGWSRSARFFNKKYEVIISQEELCIDDEDNEVEVGGCLTATRLIEFFCIAIGAAVSW